MRLAAVDDVRLRHAAIEGADAGLHLRAHPGFEVGKHVTQVLHTDAADQRVLVGPIGVQAVDVGQDDQLPGAECRGQRGGG